MKFLGILNIGSAGTNTCDPKVKRLVGVGARGGNDWRRCLQKLAPDFQHRRIGREIEVGRRGRKPAVKNYILGYPGFCISVTYGSLK